MNSRKQYWGGLFLIFVCFCNQTLAQSSENEVISGLWRGVITQDEGGYRSEYDFEMYFNQNGNEVKGRSYVVLDDVFVIMELEGTLHNSAYLSFYEIKMIDFIKKEGMEWCIKTGQLQIKKTKNATLLEGFWQGKTSFSTCVPGKIKLKRVPDQV